MPNSQPAPAIRADQAELAGETLEPSMLEILAYNLAESHSHPPRFNRYFPLLTRLQTQETLLHAAYTYFRRDTETQVSLTYAAEWLLDNFYLVRQAYRQIREDMPESFYRKLPKLDLPSLKDYPRIYELAWEIIQYSQSLLDIDHVLRFIQAYQQVQTLTIGEVWALPTMLRMGILESLTQAITNITGQPYEALPTRKNEGGQETSKGGPPSQAPVNLDQILDSDHKRGKALTDDAVVANCIQSLRVLATQDWKEFFESASRVELGLRRDPAKVYYSMDFETRDRYRHAVEELALKSGRDEEDVVREAVGLAQNELSDRAVGGQSDQTPPRSSHVGFYLIDDGRARLEARVGYSPPWYVRIRRWLFDHSLLVYLGGIATLTLLLTIVLVAYAVYAGGTVPQLIGVVALALLPATAGAIALENWLVTLFIPPRLLPRLDFREGIPAEFRTMVVLPTILTNKEEVKYLLHQLELHYLSDSDPHIHFALLTDHNDAPQKHMPGDEALLEQAKAGIRNLNLKYGKGDSGPFYLFHRDRMWNQGEDCWMGWERKRGKLEEFNRLLSGSQDTTYKVQMGDLNVLSEITYTITLDSDTTMPMGGARRLIAILAHPLNKAVFDPDSGEIVSGYTILQPRVQVKPTSASRTFFTRVFAGDAGWDLYTRAVSAVYQDLFDEGSYVGKGIYDVVAFERSLKGRVPENALISHDLFEGNQGRVGLVTDIVLFEDYPPHCIAYTHRLHRWVRGDWQLLPWLLPMVPHRGEGKIPNNFSSLDRWKLLDNLRRSLLGPFVLALFIAGWLWFPGSALLWTLVGLHPLALPILTGVNSDLIHRLRGRSPSRSTRPFLVAAMRSLLLLALLPYQALIMLDAIATTLVRLTITRKRLMQWTTSAHSVRLFGTELKLALVWKQMIFAPLFSLALALLIMLINPAAVIVAAPLLVIWFISPLIAVWIDRPLTQKPTSLSTGQQRRLLRLARRTWLYFEHFVGPEDSWLPPDHFQENPRGLVAHRTSPTNIGLLLLSTLAAYDMGYVDLVRLALLLRSTFDAMDKLERYRGHFLNWYETQNLEPLPPRYVSTVDSGNLAGCLLALKQGCLDIIHAPVLDWPGLQGLLDTLDVLVETVNVLEESTAESVAAPLQDHLTLIRRRILEAMDNPDSWVALIRWLGDECRGELERLLMALVTDTPTMDTAILDDLRIWSKQVRLQLVSVQTELDLLLPWLGTFSQPPDLFSQEEVEPALKDAWRALQKALPITARFDEIPEICRAGLGCLVQLQILLDEDSSYEGYEGIKKARSWCERLNGELNSAQTITERLQTDYKALSDQAEVYLQDMDFGFLFDDQRQVFHIGYNVEAERLDGNYYDLLASEARLASLIAIAKGDVPQSHWLHMARPITQVNGKQALLSWSGTMFEYLMPSLLMRDYQQTLVDETRRTVVDRQIEYGRQKGVPWGISESSYFHFDANMNYQYRAFGVPGLGFKRGLGDNLVISPYSSLLALPVRPQAVMANISHLAELQMIGLYGFYEAIDFTSSRLPKGKEYAIVHSYMAHHQGMILLALDNYLNDDAMIRRFHADPRIQSVELLLQEQIPEYVSVEYPHPQVDVIIRPLQPRAVLEAWHPTKDIALPQVHCLSNGRYSLLITNAGGGYSRLEELDLTRWRADTTLDNWGTWIYIQDRDTGTLWSAGYQPIASQPDSHEVRFYPHKVEFQRRDHGISVQMAITVSPEDNVEIRWITLTNHGDLSRRLALSSYGEVVLAPQDTDRRHPAFNKLFIESEYLQELNALLFHRRPRSDEEKPIYLAHLLIGERGTFTSDFESDRARFLGRGRTAHSPAALRGESPRLSGSTGATLDPVMVLSQHIDMEPHSTAHLAYVTMAAESRQEVLDLAHRYQAWPRITRTFEQAQSYSERELNELGLTPTKIEVYQTLLSVLLYPHKALRAGPVTLAANSKGQSGLWPYTISGDYPILLARVGVQEEVALVRELLQAHAYWRYLNIKVDLVIFNQRETGYEQELQGQLHRLIARTGSDIWLNQRGGIFLLRADQMGEADQVLVETAARAVLDAGEGTLAEQLEGLREQLVHLPAFVPTTPASEDVEPTPSLSRPSDLLFDNGLGGFSADGREYVIFLEPGQWTPAPWINVIANAQFGTLVSEAGMGFTWAENSGENRLTPWHNDPVVDPPAEAIYLRDEETGRVWTPTPLPSRTEAPYLVRHGAGYSIFEHNSHGLKQRLEIFVVPDAPVKVVRMRLENTWSRTRRITVTYYSEWVLGSSREAMAQYILPEFNTTCHALLARNPYNAEFGQRVAFLAATREPHGLTADRTEFLGRLGNYDHPAALDRVGLTAKVEAGADPCAAMQVLLWLAPGEIKEVTFLLGQGANLEDTIRLIRRYQNLERVVNAWESLTEFWDDLLDTITVQTPDPAMDLIFNRWLLYQSLSCRIWGRSALYQSSGAYGYRDQLQDVMAMVHTKPEITREQILRAARHQFGAGDVLHWWHPPSGRGVRTRCSDDLLWLPFVTAHYLSTTGDISILSETAPFLEGVVLEKAEDERYGLYETGTGRYTLYEHCCRALDKGTTSGPHNLPLMGSGDWNDGMNRVGIGGKGESVWLGWFLYATLDNFAPYCELMADDEKAAAYRRRAEELRRALEANAWDGNWYRRAYYDDGTPLGSAENSECQIDSIAQSWAVLSRAADPNRTARAMESVANRLVRVDDKLLLLFTPPFDQTKHDPGYIKGYLPGIRENGGQYTHAALWAVWAFAELGMGDIAGDLIRLLNPVYHSDTQEKMKRYRVEPYVVAADVYGVPPHTGRGGWTWYTGSAAWMYRLFLEPILGLRRKGDNLQINPCIPKDWPGYRITYRNGKDIYHILVENPNGVSQGVKHVTLDGESLPDAEIPMIGDGQVHEVRVLMGKERQ